MPLSPIPSETSPGYGACALVLAVALGCARDPAALPPDLDAELQRAAREADPLLGESLAGALEAARRGEQGALSELAMTCEANGLGEPAARLYACLLERAPADAEERARLGFRIGCSYERSGLADEALTALQEARRLAPGYAPGHWRAGNLLLDAGRVAEAEAAFAAALALEPEAVPALLGLARARLLADRPAEARALLEPLAAARPNERLVQGLLARALRALGDEDGARAALEADARASETHWVDPWTAEVERRATGVSNALQRGNECMLAGDPAGALAVMEPALERAPESLALLQLVVRARIDAGQLARARTLVDEGRSRFPDTFKLEYLSGLIDLQRKALPRAREQLRGALALNPAFGPAWAALGEVELRDDALEPAAEAFAQALELGANDLRTRVLYAQVEMQRGELAHAGELLEGLRADFPTSVVPLAHLAELHARRREVSEARALLEQAERIDPSFTHLASVRRRIAELEGAEEELPR